MRSAAPSLVLLLSLPALARAEVYRPTRVSRVPTIDGRLDEPEWSEALVVSDFIQRLPQEGREPSERTEVLLMYTANELLVGVRAHDSAPRGIVATVLKRDDFDLTRDDQFVIAIDSYDDGRNGYWFSTNPLGVRVDAQFAEEGEVWQDDWNGIWDCASHVEADGWTSELRIPFATLRFKPGPENVMGINLFRRVIRSNEQLFAPLIPLRYANGTPNVSAARQYVFAGIAAGRDFRVRPYALARQQWLGGAPSAPPEASHAKVGGDATYGLTASLAANVTVNTDFALAELDDRQINLTRFDLFYPERRDFFTENGGLFLFGLPQEAELFFSRRIGLREEADGSTAEVPLRFGGKLTGRAGAFELGVLEVRTGGSRGESENFVVTRTKYGFGQRSYVGFGGTHRMSEGRFDNAAVGVDATAYLVGDVGVSGFLAATHDAGSSSWPLAWNGAFFKRGEQAAFRAALTEIDTRFDPAVGFLLRRGVRKLDGELRLPWYFRASRVRRLVPAYAGTRVERKGAGIESWSHALSATLDLPSEDSFKLYAQRSFDAVTEPFTIFRDQLVPGGRYGASLVGVAVTTKPGRRLSANATAEAGGFYDGTRRTLSSNVSWRPSRNYALGVDYATSRVRLPASSFRAELIQARLDLARDTHLSGRVLVQYDNASQDLGVNIRVNYLFREGTELAFVCGRRDDRSAAALALGQGPDSVALLKFTWLASF